MTRQEDAVYEGNRLAKKHLIMDNLVEKKIMSNKQEEIREELARRIAIRDDKGFLNHITSKYKITTEQYEFADRILAGLHSQGIKLPDGSSLIEEEKCLKAEDIIADPCKGCPRRDEDDWGYVCDIACGKRSQYLAMLEGARLAIKELSSEPVVPRARDLF